MIKTAKKNPRVIAFQNRLETLRTIQSKTCKTQEQIAREMGLPLLTIGRWLRGETKTAGKSYQVELLDKYLVKYSFLIHQ